MKILFILMTHDVFETTRSERSPSLVPRTALNGTAIFI